MTSINSIDKDNQVDGGKNSIDELIQTWEHTDLKLNEPAPTELIMDTQQKLDFTFPDDFINFYKQVNGFKDWDVIGNMFSIWPLERIVEEYEQSLDKDFIPFCDFLIDSHRIGYLRTQSGTYKNIDLTKVADTFEETIQLIIENSRLLY